MNKIISWIKANKLSTLLLLLILYLVSSPFRPTILGRNLSLLPITPASPESFSFVSKSTGAPEAGLLRSASDAISPVPPIEEPVAPTDSPNRLVIRDTSLSLVVSNVPDSIKKIESIAEEFGGFLVNSNLNLPEGASSGNITIRVRSDQRLQALEAIRVISARVVSESISGRDVTDQYEDIKEQLAILEQTKAKFEAILDQATQVQDLLQVQQELLNLQRQIDNLKGRQQYLEKSAELTKITVYLSTDELALPFTPDTAWRPKVVFKQAVRSLILTARNLANQGIWLLVYSVIWLPALLIAILIYKRLNRPRTN